MILEDGQDPLRLWQYAERYLGAGTRAYSRFSQDLEISEPYHPQLGLDRFAVPTFRVPPGRGDFLRNALESTVIKLYRHGDGFLLPVHPETLAFTGLPDRDALAERGPDLTVVPSANARTVFVERIGGEPVEPHFVKLHYPRRLSRFTRRLRRPIISVQLWVAEELAAAGLPILPEVGAGVLGTTMDEAWGFLIRETRPRATPGPPPATEYGPVGDPGSLPGTPDHGPVGDPGSLPGTPDYGPVGDPGSLPGTPDHGPVGDPGAAAGTSGRRPTADAGVTAGHRGSGTPRFTVPLFALYGQDVRRPGDPPLMAQLVARSGEDPAAWLAARVVAPMVRLWLHAVSATGCVPEPHGQNTLFAFDPAGRRTAILYRDCGVYIDPATRAERGLTRELPPVNVISRDVRQPRERVFSLTYDSFMAHHALERLARVAAETLGADPERLRHAARTAFAAGPPVELPPTVHYYEDRLHGNGRWNLVDTGEPPAWR